MIKWISAFALCLTAAMPAAAADREISFDEYGDWRALVRLVEGGEETWRECVAYTGGDGEPLLEVSARQYDAGPPYNYPQVQVREHAPRHYKTLLQEGGRVNLTFDDGDGYGATAFNEVAEDVFQVGIAQPAQEDMLYVLQGMRRAGQLDITFEGRLLLEASLRGFTAAYGKIAEACEFSTEGVI